MLVMLLRFGLDIVVILTFFDKIRAKLPAAIITAIMASVHVLSIFIFLLFGFWFLSSSSVFESLALTFLLAAFAVYFFALHINRPKPTAYMLYPDVIQGENGQNNGEGKQ